MEMAMFEKWESFSPMLSALNKYSYIVTLVHVRKLVTGLLVQVILCVVRI